MGQQVVIEDRDGVALITLNRPPGNALTPEMRRDLSDVLKDAIGQPGIAALVLCGAGRGFSSGVDLSEFESDQTAPSLGDLCGLIEDSPKPVVCALHGMAFGAGFELALAAHGRVAQRDTRLALPDVKLGMVPGGGATQRLPRILGAQISLEIMLTGQAFVASDPRFTHLITKLVSDNPIEQAVALARTLATRGTWLKTRDANIGFSDPSGFQKAVRTVNAKLAGATGAAHDILSCVEAAQLLPFEQGLAFEQSLYNDRLSTPEARSARHLVIAKHRASRAPVRIKTPPSVVRHILLIGEGGLLGETALACIEAGLQVSVLTPDSASAANLDERISQVWNKTHDDVARITARQDRLIITDDAAKIAPADLVLDAGQGAGLPASRLRPDAVWLAIASDVDPARAGALAGAKRALSLRFYRPVHIAQIVELSIPRQADPQAIATVLSFLGRIRRIIIQTALPAGSVGERLVNAMFAGACQLVSEGANPYDVDDAACDLGFAIGPFLMMDQVGLQAVRTRLETYESEKTFGAIEMALLDAMVEQGRTGQAMGEGFYLHTSDAATRDPDLPGRAADLAIADRAASFDSSALTAALLGALVNEAVTLIAEGGVRRASDFDLLLVRGFGFDAARGGPLLWTDTNGLFTLYQQMQGLAHMSRLWQPHAKLTDMIRNGQGFFGRTGG